MNKHNTFQLEAPTFIGMAVDEFDVTDAWVEESTVETDAEATATICTDDPWPRLVSIEVQDHDIDMTYHLNRGQAVAMMGSDSINRIETVYAEYLS